MKLLTNLILFSIPQSYFGANLYNHQEIRAAKRVISHKSPFRYYGSRLTHETSKFEKKCQQFYGVKYAHAVNSGTGGISCALHALGIGLGDEVLIPGFLWIAVSNMVLLHGAIPVLCEIDESLNVDVNDLQQKITKKTKCVIVIHMEGTQAPIMEIKTICDQHQLKILEDFSQCNGGTLGSKKIGSFGDISIASLQLNKQITCGEGGIILTDNEEYYHRIVTRSDFGFHRSGEICFRK